jgi:hypothetical protein
MFRVVRWGFYKLPWEVGEAGNDMRGGTMSCPINARRRDEVLLACCEVHVGIKKDEGRGNDTYGQDLDFFIFLVRRFVWFLGPVMFWHGVCNSIEVNLI